MKKCPNCGGDFISVVYGYPTDETMKRAMMGEFKLGGCVLGGPSGYCRKCDKYSEDGIKQVSFDQRLKQEAPIRYYFNKLLIYLRIVVFLPPIFIYTYIKDFFKK